MKTNANLHCQLELIRPQLLRFARQRLHDNSLAEDMVQDSLLAVLEAPDRFHGKSSLSTYVISILKFKIIDNFRHQMRFHEIDSQEVTELDMDWSTMRDRYGIAHSSLCHEFNPLNALEQKNFFIHLENALTEFSARNALAFTMADCLDIANDEICEELAISKNNLMVTIHRVRQGLRKSPLLQTYSSAFCH